MGLEGRVALVTGASGSGMGRSIALTLARDGADIAVHYGSNAERADEVVRTIASDGRRAAAYAADIGSAEDIASMTAAVIKDFGRIDILINGAGGPWTPRDITEIEPAHFDDVLRREITSTFVLIRGVLPGMRERGWGRIVSIGGYMADEWRFGPPDAPLDYPLGKAGRHWLTRTLAPRELPRGITINAVAPGPTARFTLEEAVAAVRGNTPPSDGNTPQTIAEVVSFLCSDAAARVTGAVIPIPGATPV